MTIHLKSTSETQHTPTQSGTSGEVRFHIEEYEKMNCEAIGMVSIADEEPSSQAPFVMHILRLRKQIQLETMETAYE